MRINLKFTKLFMFLISVLSFNIYAQNNDAKSLPSTGQDSKDSVQKNDISVSPKIEAKKEDQNVISLNVKSLDNAWENRESKEVQEIILKFLQSEPTVPENFDIAWRVARLVYFSGNFGIGEGLSNDDHVKIFLYGYKAAEIAKKLEPTKAEGYYWYAVNIGSYGLAKGVLSALNNASLGRDALLEVVKIDPSYHWGGAYRVLGRYYQEVPRIISFGDKKKAKEYFEKAIEVAPNYIVNTMYLGVLVEDVGEKTDALKLFRDAEKMPDLDGKNEVIRYKRELAEDIKKVQD